MWASHQCREWWGQGDICGSARPSFRVSARRHPRLERGREGSAQVPGTGFTWGTFERFFQRLAIRVLPAAQVTLPSSLGVEPCLIQKGGFVWDLERTWRHRTHVLKAPGLSLSLLQRMSRTNRFFVFMELSCAQPQDPSLTKIPPLSHVSKRSSPVSIQCSQADGSPLPKFNWGLLVPLARGQFLFLLLFSPVNQLYSDR